MRFSGVWVSAWDRNSELWGSPCSDPFQREGTVRRNHSERAEGELCFPLLLTIYSKLSPFIVSPSERAPVPESTSVLTRRCGISDSPCSRRNSVLRGPRGESPPNNHQRLLSGGTPLSSLSQHEMRGDVPRSPAFYYITVRPSKPLMQGRTTPLAAEEVRPTVLGNV